MSEWVEITLSDIIDIIGGGTPKTSNSEYWNGDIPWLSVVDFNNGRKFVETTEKSITEKGLAISSTKLLNKGDIIISARGTVGAMAILKMPMAFNQSCYGIRPIQKIADANFVYYLLKESIPKLGQISHGGVFNTITRESFQAIQVLFPPLLEQKAIAGVLSSLDDKIDLLHRQNKTLEAMAKTLFRQWFIEEAEDDWEVVELQDVALRITDGAHQSPPTTEVGFPMASVKDMNDWGINMESCRRISEADYNKLICDDCRPLKNDILIAKDGSYLKHIFCVDKDLDAVILSSIAIIRPNGIYHPFLLTIYLKLDSTRSELENIVTGAVIPRIVLKNFRKFKLTLPPKKKQEEAIQTIQPIIDKCNKNYMQIQTLEKLRETLLPKLMSGEVMVELE